jgi:hypothetical protein
MNGAIKLIIVVVVVALIAFPILWYLNIDPFAYYGNMAYAYLHTQITTTFSTVYGLVGTTGVGLAGTAAFGYAYNQIKKQKAALSSWATKEIKGKDETIGTLTGQTEELTSATKLKDEAFTTVSKEKEQLSTQYSEIQNKYASMQQTVEQQKTELFKQSQTIESQISGVIPSNKVFTSSDGLKQIITIEKKVVV